MKYLSLLVVVLGIGLYLTRKPPTASIEEALDATEIPVSAASAPAPSAAGGEPTPRPVNAFKRPIDRARSVAEQVKGRNGDGEF